MDVQGTDQTNESSKVKRHLGIKIGFVLILATSCLSAHADTQFMCSFGSTVKLSKLDQEDPRPIIEKDSSRYTFIVSNNSSEGSYINLKYGQVLPTYVYSNGNIITFLEKNSSDNLFIVTAFVGRQEGVFIPAVFTQNSWSKNIDFYHPSTSLGSCVKLTK